MEKGLRIALENLIDVSLQIGKPNANYIIGDYCISIREAGSLPGCKDCILIQNGLCAYDNKFECPMSGMLRLPNEYGEEMPNPCNTDCWNYAQGTCPYIGGDKYQCPRYRLYEL